MTEKSFVYYATATLDDGSEVTLDLEEHGWADKELLARTRRWALIPNGRGKTMTGVEYPVVSVNIPVGAKPIFRSRVVATMKPGVTVPAFRAYCIGWMKGSLHVWTWVLPTGDIECGTDDECHLADVLRGALNQIMTLHD